MLSLLPPYYTSNPHPDIGPFSFLELIQERKYCFRGEHKTLTWRYLIDDPPVCSCSVCRLGGACGDVRQCAESDVFGLELCRCIYTQTGWEISTLPHRVDQMAPENAAERPPPPPLPPAVNPPLTPFLLPSLTPSPSFFTVAR